RQAHIACDRRTRRRKGRRPASSRRAPRGCGASSVEIGLAIRPEEGGEVLPQACLIDAIEERQSLLRRIEQPQDASPNDLRGPGHARPSTVAPPLALSAAPGPDASGKPATVMGMRQGPPP